MGHINFVCWGVHWGGVSTMANTVLFGQKRVSLVLQGCLARGKKTWSHLPHLKCNELANTEIASSSACHVTYGANYHACGNKYTLISWQFHDVYVFLLNSSSSTKKMFTYLYSCLLQDKFLGGWLLIQNRWCSGFFTYVYVYWTPNFSFYPGLTHFFEVSWGTLCINKFSSKVWSPNGRTKVQNIRNCVNLSCTRLQVPPVALHVSQLISWIL